MPSPLRWSLFWTRRHGGWRTFFEHESVYTLYTPNTAAIIQRFLEGKAIFDAQSATGFSKWNVATSRMEPYSHRINAGSKVTVPIKDLSEASLGQMFAEYDRVIVKMSDGNWKGEIPVPTASSSNRGRILSIDHQATYASDLVLNGKKLKMSQAGSRRIINPMVKNGRNGMMSNEVSNANLGSSVYQS